jgi:hypothetical protein
MKRYSIFSFLLVPVFLLAACNNTRDSNSTNDSDTVFIHQPEEGEQLPSNISDTLIVPDTSAHQMHVTDTLK